MSRKLPPLKQLEGVLTVLENRSKRPVATVLAAVGEMVRDAITVLQEPDPTKQRIGFILLAIQQSTEVRQVSGHSGKQVFRVKIIDQPLYSWAMHEVHAMAGTAK